MDVAKNEATRPPSQKSSDRSLGRSSESSFKERMKALEDDFEEVEEDEPLMDGPTTLVLNPLHSPTSSPAEKTTPSEILLLVDKLIEPLIDCSKKGIGRTRLILDLKTLSKVEIVIDHYDIAPHTFHIKLMGDEKAQLLFNQHKSALETQLKNALPTFNCAIAAPTYRPRSFLKDREEKNTLVKSDKLKYGGDKEAWEAHG